MVTNCIKYFVLIVLCSMFLGAIVCGCNKVEAEYKDTEETTVEATEITTEATEIEIIMIGDILAHEGVYGSGLTADGTYNFDHLFKYIKTDAENADIAIVNQETILGGTEMGLSAYPMFNSPQEIGDALVNAGFNVILHATNHTLDKGSKGVDNTIKFWKEKYPDIAVLGIHDSQEDYDNNSVYIYEKEGVKVAILNYTYGTNGNAVPKKYMINILDEDKVKKDLEYASANSDFVVVCPHWGTEYRHNPDNSQIKWAKFFAENGADLVIGTHPHVVQPVEYIDNGRGGKTLVYYSLGNFVSNQDTVATMLGAMAKVKITNRGGDVHISGYGVEPLVTHMLFGRGLITTYKLRDYNDQLAAENKVSIFGARLTMEKLDEIYKDVFSNMILE